MLIGLYPFLLLLGDQAEIIFTLIGEPPFTFTYQRSELAPKKGGPGKVLETHTVSRVLTHEYSIFSALEGWYFINIYIIIIISQLWRIRNMDCNVYIRSLLSLPTRTTRSYRRKT